MLDFCSNCKYTMTEYRHCLLSPISHCSIPFFTALDQSLIGDMIVINYAGNHTTTPTPSHESLNKPYGCRLCQFRQALKGHMHSNGNENHNYTDLPDVQFSVVARIRWHILVRGLLSEINICKIISREWTDQCVGPNFDFRSIIIWGTTDDQATSTVRMSLERYKKTIGNVFVSLTATFWTSVPAGWYFAWSVRWRKNDYMRVPVPCCKVLRSSPVRWSKIRTKPSSLPLTTQLPCNADVTWRGTFIRIGWRYDCVCCKEDEAVEITYESMPFTRLDIRMDLWSVEKAA